VYGKAVINPRGLPKMTEFSVNDMTCGHCSSKIARAISGVDSNAKAEIDLQTKTVRVTSDKPAARFLEAIRDAGYTAALSSAGAASSRSSCCRS
jgi:copper chaperone